MIFGASPSQSRTLLAGRRPRHPATSRHLSTTCVTIVAVPEGEGYLQLLKRRREGAEKTQPTTANFRDTAALHCSADALRGIYPRFAGDQLTPAFCSDLSELVERSGAVLWVHGHTNESCDYIAGATRAVCNPKGYDQIRQGGRFENANFDSNLVVEV